MMATLSSLDMEKSLKMFSESLEDLTFNSKPIIDDLTRFANTYRELAPMIVQKMEGRILEVRPEWKLPSLYLMDSILKNLKGDYVTLLSKNIVHVFCHCFEKLVDPDARKALYKLRQTWPQYFPNRKLAAIDLHVKTLDPNWPVTAVDKDPPSPTIYFNPRFLKAKENENSKISSGQVKTARKSEVDSKRQSEQPSSGGMNEAGSVSSKVPQVARDPRNESDNTSIREKRRKLLHEKQSERMKQEEAMGLTNNTHLKVPKDRSGHSHTPPSSRGSSPLTLHTSRARSASPRSTSQTHGSSHIVKQTNHTKKRSGTNVKESKESVPPAEKRARVDTDTSLTHSDHPGSNPEAKLVKVSGKQKKAKTKPIKKSHLQLDDLPPELLPKHQELILKQIKHQLQNGNLTPEQHHTLVKQLEQLYELQKLKDEEVSKDCSQSDKTSLLPDPTDPATNLDQVKVECPSKEQADIHRPDGTKEISRKEFISLSDSKSNSVFFVDKCGTVDNENSHFPHSRRGGRPPRGYRGNPQPHGSFEPFPPEDRYYAGPPGGGSQFRGEPRPPYRPRRGRPFYPRGPRGGQDRYFDGSEVRPPSMGPRARGSGRNSQSYPPQRHPWPPHWRQPHGKGDGVPPAGPNQPPAMEASKIFDQLVLLGMIKDSEDSSQSSLSPGEPSTQRSEPDSAMEASNSQGSAMPVSVPTLSFTPATLKQKYASLVSLLHVGEQCSSCGLRFVDRSGDFYGKHLDWHYNLNRMESEGLQNTSKNWFIHPEDWLKLEELAEETPEKEILLRPSQPLDKQEIMAVSTSAEVSTSCQVLPREGSEVCNSCHEPLEQFWEEDEEEWHFKEAMRGSSGKLYHIMCFEDVKEEDANVGTGSIQSVKEEILTD